MINDEVLDSGEIILRGRGTPENRECSVCSTMFVDYRERYFTSWVLADRDRTGERALSWYCHSCADQVPEGALSMEFVERSQGARDRNDGERRFLAEFSRRVHKAQQSLAFELDELLP